MGESEEDGVRFQSVLLESALAPPDRPENTAREEDLVVQLLGGPTFDHGALLVVHIDVVPHIVRRGNRTNVVYLQHQGETKLAHQLKKKKRNILEGREI